MSHEHREMCAHTKTNYASPVLQCVFQLWPAGAFGFINWVPNMNHKMKG